MPFFSNAHFGYANDCLLETGTYANYQQKLTRSLKKFYGTVTHFWQYAKPNFNFELILKFGILGMLGIRIELAYILGARSLVLLRRQIQRWPFCFLLIVIVWRCRENYLIKLCKVFKTFYTWRCYKPTLKKMGGTSAI